MVDVTVRILGKFDTATPATKNGDAIEDSDLVEDAIQLFFDKCERLGITYNEGIEKLHWAIIKTADKLPMEGRSDIFCRKMSVI